MRTRKITLDLPVGLLDRAKRMAERDGLPVSEVLIELIALGLFDLEESDQYEGASYH